MQGMQGKTRKFDVYRGGSNLPPSMSGMRLIDSYVTDTRLMGVVGVFAHWKVTYYRAPEKEEDFSQFFYFETEEYGFEEYASVCGDDKETVKKIESNLFGGLGGKKIPIGESELLWLLKTFVDFNLSKNQPLPDKREEYMYLISNPVEFSAKERASIMNKICTPIVNNYQAIHYFLMRLAGKDFSAAAHLIKGNILLNQMETVPISTMVMNTIDIDTAGEECTYMAETLLDCTEDYLLVVSQLTVDKEHRIIDYHALSSMRISPQEASMKLRKSEYVTNYAYDGGVELFESSCPDLVERAVASEQEAGSLYLRFCPNNDHVKKRVFRLNDDVEGIYFVSRGQIIAAAYTLTSIMQLEHELKSSRIAGRLFPTAKYEFKEPLIYEYISSGIEDFNEFVDLIRQDTPSGPDGKN
jgi:hypothetical protein